MSAQKGQKYSKYWMFTENNPTDDQAPLTWEGVDFVVWQKEKGESGTPHLQGYVVFVKQKRLTGLKKINGRCDWQSRVGSHEQAKHYCSKPHQGCTCAHCTKAVGQRLAGPWVHGEESEGLRAQGKRSDLLALKRALDDGLTERQIASGEHFPVWAKYGKVVQRYRRLTMPQRDWLTEVVVYWGEPGIGKTSRARYEAGPDAFWLSKPGGQTTWWDDYDGQEVVVIDEFYGWIARDLMCRLCDRYPLNVETKGGSTRFLAKKIIITSNIHPQYWWPRVGLGAMARRLMPPMGRVIEMTAPWTAPAIVNLIDEALAARINEQLTLACDETLDPESHDEGTEYLYVNPLSISQGAIDWDNQAAF